MNFLVSICTEQFQPLWNVVGLIIKTIWIGIPILLIVLGSIDLGKAVIASKEEEVKKAKKTFINRLLYAVAVFAVVWLVRVIFSVVAGIGVTEVKDDNGNVINTIETNDWQNCWKMIK